MLRRVFALLGLLALSPADATLIEYSFSGSLFGPVAPYYLSTTHEAFGVEEGDRITGGFLFDDAAPRTSYTELADGSSTSTYDMSDLRFWIGVGDYVLRATGSQLTISDAARNPLYP